VCSRSSFSIGYRSFQEYDAVNLHRARWPHPTSRGLDGGTGPVSPGYPRPHQRRHSHPALPPTTWDEI